jgi:hypothetical protein
VIPVDVALIGEVCVDCVHLGLENMGDVRRRRVSLSGGQMPGDKSRDVTKKIRFKSFESESKFVDLPLPQATTRNDSIS